MSVGLIKSNRWMVSTIICCVLVVAILLSAGVALANGQANITLGEVYQILFYKISHGLVGDLSGISDANINIVWFVRAPRVLLSIFVGMGLAISGAVMQAVVQNPLADPYILGSLLAHP